MSKRDWDLFGNEDLFRREQDSNPDRIEYKLPEEKLFDIGLIIRLLEHYIDKIYQYNIDLGLWRKDNFESEVEKLEAMIKDTGDKFNPQFLIDALTIKLKEESDTGVSSRAEYLTAVIQALYNLDYASEFVIDTREWGKNEDSCHVGDFLKGSRDKPLILDLYGNFYWGAHWTEYCNFTLHNIVEHCGTLAEHCNFIIHGKVTMCGFDASYCTFSLMPHAEIEHYHADPLKGNVRKIMNDAGEWIEITGTGPIKNR